MPLIKQRFGKVNSEASKWASAVVEVWDIENATNREYPDWVMANPEHYYAAMNSYGQQTYLDRKSLYKNSVESGIYPGFPDVSERSSVFISYLQHLRNLVIHDHNMREQKGVGENLIPSIHRIELAWLPKHQRIIFEDAINAVLASPDTIENKTQRIRSFFEEHLFLLGNVRVRFADIYNINEAMLLPERPDPYDNPETSG